MPPGPGPENLNTLSNDAIAGIAVGVVLTIALMGIFVFWLLRRWRRRTQKDHMLIPPAYAAKHDGFSKPAPRAQAHEKPQGPVSGLQGLPLLPGATWATYKATRNRQRTAG